MHQRDTCYVALRGPTSVQGALVDGLLIGVDTELDHTKRYCTSNKDVASAIC